PFLPDYDIIGHQTNWIARYDPNGIGGGGGEGNSFAPGGGDMLLSGGEVSECSTGGPVYLTNIVAAQDVNSGLTVTFTVAGGTNDVPYDIFSTTNLMGGGATNSVWTWLGSGYTCNSYLLTN